MDTTPIDLHVNESTTSSSTRIAPRTRPAPQHLLQKRKNLVFSYASSEDGVDTNLLILLHGRGDSETPFFKLGKSLQLPQTAILAVRGPEIVPLLDEHEREWWNETDMLGMNVQNQNPSPAISLLLDVIEELCQPPYTWSPQNIHLFGFGQGGTLACEAAIQQFRRKTSASSTPSSSMNVEGSAQQSIGSVVSIHGPLLSLPTSGSIKVPCPVVYFSRLYTSSKHPAELAALQRAFTRVEAIKLPGKQGEMSMPKNREEWQGIMKFWSEVLKRKNAWELSQDDAPNSQIYDVSAGGEQVNVPGSGPADGGSEGKTDQKKEGGGARKRSPSSSSQLPAGSSPQASTIDPTVRPAAAVSGFKRGFLSKGF